MSLLLNDRALALVDSALADAARLRIAATTSPSGTRVVDCGVALEGSVDAGLLLARVALADLGRVWVEPAGSPAAPGRSPAAGDAWGGSCPWPTVAVASESPVAACLASQYAGWKVAAGKFFAMASGPMRAAIGREALYDDIGHRERPAAAVGLLETAKLPPDDVCVRLAADCGLGPDRLTLLAARTASLAGTLQVVARSLETALHKLHDLHFDLGRIRAGHGRAPLPPIPADDMEAIGRTNDAILYGGAVVLEATGDDASLADIAARMVSGASASHGRPFRDLFAAAGYDFYALDPALFAPAVVEILNVDTGRRHRAGSLAADVLRASFGDA